MVRIVEVYRGVAIERTAEVLGFNVGARGAFCVQLRFRREDDAPILDMFSNVEAARREIDEAAEEALNLRRWNPSAVETVEAA